MRPARAPVWVSCPSSRTFLRSSLPPRRCGSTAASGASVAPNSPTRPRSCSTRSGLKDGRRRLLSKFSRGMLQRLGLAQALLGSPEVLVLDEPASGLDPVGQRDIRNLMLELRDEGATILLSSHQLSEVETVSDEVTILNRGLGRRPGSHRRPAQRGRRDLDLSSGHRRAADGVAELVRDVAVHGASTRLLGRRRSRQAVVDHSTMLAGSCSRSAPSAIRSRTTSRGSLPRCPMRTGEAAGDARRVAGDRS